MIKGISVVLCLRIQGCEAFLEFTVKEYTIRYVSTQLQQRIGAFDCYIFRSSDTHLWYWRTVSAVHQATGTEFTQSIESQ